MPFYLKKLIDFLINFSCTFSRVGGGARKMHRRKQLQKGGGVQPPPCILLHISIMNINYASQLKISMFQQLGLFLRILWGILMKVRGEGDLKAEVRGILKQR